MFSIIKISIIIIISLLTVGCGSGREENSGPPEPENIPFQQLHVHGNRILNESGHALILRGVAIIDPYFLKEVYYNLRESDFRTLAEDWNVKILRIPIHPGLWKLNSNYLADYVDPIIEWCGKYGMYAFLDWHAQGNPITGETINPSWANTPPWNGNPYDPNKELAISALQKMALRYKDTPWMIYGTFNEPAYINWNEWRPVAEELVDSVHAIAPDAVVMVSGVDWGYDLSSAIADPVKRGNVIYEFHPYPWKGEEWKDHIPELSQKYPVFAGEWGYGDVLSPGINADNYGKPLVDFCKTHNIGWTAWIFHHEWGPPILKYADIDDVTEFGALVKSSL